jgi:hypothetical protein
MRFRVRRVAASVGCRGGVRGSVPSCTESILTHIWGKIRLMFESALNIFVADGSPATTGRTTASESDSIGVAGMGHRIGTSPDGLPSTRRGGHLYDLTLAGVYHDQNASSGESAQYSSPARRSSSCWVRGTHRARGRGAIPVNKPDSVDLSCRYEPSLRCWPGRERDRSPCVRYRVDDSRFRGYRRRRISEESVKSWSGSRQVDCRVRSDGGQRRRGILFSLAPLGFKTGHESADQRSEFPRRRGRLGRSSE